MSANFKNLIFAIFIIVLVLLISKAAFFNNAQENLSINAANKTGFLENFRNKLANLISAPFIINGVIEENEFLRQANINLQYQLANLKNSAVFSKEKLTDYIQAKSLTWDTQASGVLIVDKGLKDGVVDGARVISGVDNKAIGLVLDSYQNYGRIATLYYPNLSFNIMNSSGQILGSALTSGQGGIEVDFVDKNIPLQVGEIVFTAGQDGIFTPGLIAGRVIKIDSGPTFNRLILEPVFKKSELTQVFIKKQ